MQLGILGGGQLGLMLARAARDLGIESLVVDPKRDAVAARAARHLALDWADPAAQDALAACDVVTYEFENVPSAAVEALRARVPVHPAPAALALSGDRIVEKTLFRDLGVETAPFAAVDSRADLDRAVDEIGLPAILKTRRFGYDGKGQALLRSPADLDAAWARLGERPLILEGFVAFDREVSLIAVRAADGATRVWPATENEHVDGILHLSRAPAADLAEATFASGRRALDAVMTKLDYVGVLVIEFFQVDDALVANEMACRVHNSGHWTIEGAATSQFENHIRAICGLPLSATGRHSDCVMTNLIGFDVEALPLLLAEPGTLVHLYGKSDIRDGRKMGHVTRLLPKS